MKIHRQSPAWETNYLEQTPPPQTIITALPSRNLKWEKLQSFMCLNLMFKQTSVILFLLSVDSQNVSSESVQNHTLCEIDRTTKAVWSAFIGIYSVANGWVASLKLLRRGRERDPSSGTAPMGKEGMWLKYKTLVLLHWQALNVQTVIRSAAVWSLPSKEEGFYINKSLVRWSNLSLLLKLRLSKLSLECNSF